MSYNGIFIKNIKEFQDLQDLAITKGLKTVEEFNKFIIQHFSNKANKCQIV